MTDSPWLLDESRQITVDDEMQLLRAMRTRRGKREKQPKLALTLHDVVIHNNRKWFGGADIRIDMIVTTGRRLDEADPSFFMPSTHAFPAVRDGEALPIGSGGLLGFIAVPAHFLDLSIIVSRDRRDVDELASLLRDSTDSDITDAMGKIAELTATPHVAAVKTAIEAAAILSNAAYRILRSLTGSTIGLYRNLHLQHRDGFGVGRHPETGTLRCRDLTFRYEITAEPES